jgi:hypothetical protein
MRLIVTLLFALGTLGLFVPPVQAQRGGVGAGGGSSGSRLGITFRRELPADDSEARRIYREIMLAQSEVNRVLIDLRREFLASAEYQIAVAEVRRAGAEHRAARDLALHGLRQTTRYRAARIEISSLDRQLDELRSAGASGSSVAEVSSLLLQQRADLSRLEEDVLRSDETYNTARYAAIDASGELAALWKDFHDSVRFDPRSLAARSRLAAARERMASLRRR